MSVKEQVLLLLEESRDKALSGQEIADRLKVTRAAVWKAVKGLQAEGYAIEGVNNKGYLLEKAPDILSAAYIEQALRKAKITLAVQTEKEVVSTNTLLGQYVAAGETRDMVLLAEEQSAGKGRRGRSFFSPEGTGLYMSLLLHPDATPAEATMLTTLAAAAEAAALEAVTGQPVQIKWVNDVWLRGRKISGILTEGSASLEEGKLQYVIVGIGINIYEPKGGFPEEIKEVAGALLPHDISRENMRNRIASELLIRFMQFYREFPRKVYLEEYRKRCFVIGKQVRIITPDGAPVPLRDGKNRSDALVLGVDEDCHLQVRYEDGTEEFLSNGEISIRM